MIYRRIHGFWYSPQAEVCVFTSRIFLHRIFAVYPRCGSLPPAHTSLSSPTSLALSYPPVQRAKYKYVQMFKSDM